MLVDVVTEKGTYKKYQPTKEEVIELFKEWTKYNFIKPYELPEILYINLRKWKMIECYNEIINSIKSEEFNG